MPRTIWLPGGLLLLLAASEYGSPVLHQATGWPLAWCDYILQGAGMAVLWSLVVALVPRTIVLPPGVAACIMGAFEALQRPVCAVAQMLDPVDLSDGRTLCQAHTGMDLYALGIASLSVLAVLLAVWASDGRR